MGCDIHVHIEVKERATQTWHHLAAPAVRRNYVLFATMARCGRCQDITPVAENRGLPDDITFVTRADHDRYDGDAHSMSWLSRAEIDQLRERFKYEVINSGRKWDELEHDLEHGLLRTYLHGNGITDLDGTPYDDVRLVFWFDC